MNDRILMKGYCVMHAFSKSMADAYNNNSFVAYYEESENRIIVYNTKEEVIGEVNALNRESDFEMMDKVIISPEDELKWVYTIGKVEISIDSDPVKIITSIETIPFKDIISME